MANPEIRSAESADIADIMANFNGHRRPEEARFSAEIRTFRRLSMNADGWVNGGAGGRRKVGKKWLKNVNSAALPYTMPP